MVIIQRKILDYCFIKVQNWNLLYSQCKEYHPLNIVLNTGYTNFTDRPSLVKNVFSKHLAQTNKQETNMEKGKSIK